ncbi:hypothetical protein [Arthrobacter sp. U41]|uniref:hypothetical protein n=1 Tax=Arthrobacter sp. U41 TaxID=1849032 RepID=UPI0012F8924E|nr:hypothetical protein [Arthrobacter sp. U41]
MALHPQQSWLPLAGERVEIRLGKDAVDAGTVDAVTPDDGLLWLAPDGLKNRRIIDRAQGFHVWINYKWESP